MRGTRFAKLTYQATPYAIVHVVGSGGNDEESALRNDAVAAYAHALQWAMLRDQRYAAKAIEIMKTLPESDTHSWTWWWYTHWIKGPPAFLWDFSKKKKSEVIAALPADKRDFAEAVPAAIRTGRCFMRAESTSAIV